MTSLAHPGNDDTFSIRVDNVPVRHYQSLPILGRYDKTGANAASAVLYQDDTPICRPID
jgi:hypothetical protein